MFGLSSLCLCATLLAPKPGPFALGDPLPEPDHTAANVLILTGGLMVLGGLAGVLSTPGCRTRDSSARCVDAPGVHPVYSALIVFGLGATITGTFWRRRDLPD